jgi:DNA ligase D-like protein (predicted ligase)
MSKFIGIKPMLAVAGQPFNSAEWIFEPKIDGTRCIANVSEDVMLQNRRLANITSRYPELAKALAQRASHCILDGEIAVFSNGRPDFSALSVREHQMEMLKIDYLSRAMPASFVVFDILNIKGKSIMELPLSERKKILRDELQEDELVVVSDFFCEKGVDYFDAALKMGIEGIMAKRLKSTYQPGARSSDWIKIKKNLKLDLVIGGYIPGKGNRERYFGGLLLGCYESGKLVYVGRVGSGFSEKELQEIVQDFEPISWSPFANPPSTLEVKWLKPDRVVQVAAMEVTEQGHLRAPVFLRMRNDKEAQECTLDQMKLWTAGQNNRHF